MIIRWINTKKYEILKQPWCAIVHVINCFLILSFSQNNSLKCWHFQTSWSTGKREFARYLHAVRVSVSLPGIYIGHPGTLQKQSTLWIGTTGGPNGTLGGARSHQAMSAEYERRGYDIMCLCACLRPNPLPSGYTPKGSRTAPQLRNPFPRSGGNRLSP